ncbi:MAG TPA: DivIVA domain-containing protein [Marmoricola sp.]|nr:DivIVA domain-containing protein [Marmoricola sp.]
MIWILVMFTILLLGGVALVAAGYGESMRAAQSDRRTVSLPDGPVSAHDLETIEFNTGLRGYRMDEVDALLTRLVSQLADSQSSGDKTPEGP